MNRSLSPRVAPDMIPRLMFVLGCVVAVLALRAFAHGQIAALWSIFGGLGGAVVWLVVGDEADRWD